MKIRFVTSLAALAIFAIATAANAQTPGVLNSLEVKRLVASAGPADHARLAGHFLALAVKYDREATRQDALTGAFVGNPNRTWTVAPGAHAGRLADLARESAATVRALAAYHQSRASGQAAVLPEDSTRFQGGEGARVPSDGELRELAASAATPTAHRVLEEYFLTLASKHDAEATSHVATAQSYRGNAGRRTLSGDPAIMCDRMVKLSRDSADEARAAAQVHRQLAVIG